MYKFRPKKNLISMYGNVSSVSHQVKQDAISSTIHTNNPNQQLFRVTGNLIVLFPAL